MLKMRTAERKDEMNVERKAKESWKEERRRRDAMKER